MKIVIFLVLSVILTFASEYRYRKYDHVKNFIEPLIKPTIKLGLKYDVPPAAILAIACIESGYGRGYVASISGNILSLGTNKGEKELPALFLPNIKDPYKIIYNSSEIARYQKNELRYIKRAKSLKKDYRPLAYAGTSKKLQYFDNHPKEKLKANLECIEDFCKIWISSNNKYKPFKKSRRDLDIRVKIDGKLVLFQKVTIKEFIYNISGKKNSFNYRKTWAKKVISVMNNIGLVELTQDIKNGKHLNDIWK